MFPFYTNSDGNNTTEIKTKARKNNIVNLHEP